MYVSHISHVYLAYLTCISRVLLITKIILVVIITILLKIIPQQHFHRSWKSGIIEIIFLIAFEGGFCLAGKLNTALIICSTNSESYLLDSDIFSMLFLFVSVHAQLVWGCSGWAKRPTRRPRWEPGPTWWSKIFTNWSKIFSTDLTISGMLETADTRDKAVESILSEGTSTLVVMVLGRWGPEGGGGG